MLSFQPQAVQVMRPFLFNILQWEDGEDREYVSELLHQNNKGFQIYWKYLFSLSFIFYVFLPF
jgi:hypothetical protein